MDTYMHYTSESEIKKTRVFDRTNITPRIILTGCFFSLITIRGGSSQQKVQHYKLEKSMLMIPKEISMIQNVFSLASIMTTMRRLAIFQKESLDQYCLWSYFVFYVK
ncbi:hypothetical protein A7C91_00820 [Thermococcus piezophilus]|uniref:Uncharacterized protein n=1 Tax=Thermococcus piezophilus TaxID=1712654 RepID=A0A172WEQ3_9EURY|nr:hypothetical protein A7C91_00820 [Thermococcus piezophilus]